MKEYRILDEQSDSVTFEYNGRELKSLDIEGMPLEDRPYDILADLAIANTIKEECKTAALDIKIYKLATHASAAVVLSGFISISAAANRADLHPAASIGLLTGGLVGVLITQRDKVTNIRERRQRLEDHISELL